MGWICDVVSVRYDGWDHRGGRPFPLGTSWTLNVRLQKKLGQSSSCPPDDAPTILPAAPRIPGVPALPAPPLLHAPHFPQTLQSLVTRVEKRG
jgi:hypothetical protein